MIGSIPLEDFGGSGPILHFAHANAYPPACYAELLAGLAREHSVIAFHQRPLWPDAKPAEVSDWSDLADDLIEFLDQRRLKSILGVGHSLGAVTTMMASLKRPDLFRAQVLIEPVFLPPEILERLVLQTHKGEPYKSPLQRTALRRRNEWSSKEEAFAHYRAKSVFSRFSDNALWNYVDGGLTQSPNNHWHLLYSPEWEARIYSLPPTNVWQLIPQITQPTLAMRGQLSDVLNQASWDLWKQSQSLATFCEVPACGHLLPLEDPVRVIDEVVSFVRKLAGKDL